MTEPRKGKYITDFITGRQISATPEEVEAVQVFARRLVDDYGYDKGQIQTRPQFRVRKAPSDQRKSWPVDIAVFGTTDRSEDNLLMIVECKKKTVRSGRRQLESYLEHSKAAIGIWFNGKEHVYIRKVVRADGTVTYNELPNIPKAGQSIEEIGQLTRAALRPTNNLKSVFRDIRNKLAGTMTGITRDQELAPQIIILLFCKIYDEINTAPDETVMFRAGIEESPEQILDRINSLFEDDVKEEYDDVFDPDDTIRLDARSVAYVVGELQNYCITEA
jgi:type I restriction enzyme M protein